MEFQKNHRFIMPVLIWLFPASVITLMAGLIYVSVQQNYRQSANDPQIAIAEDAARVLATGISPNFLVGQSNLDMSQSLDNFLIIYDQSGKAVASSASLGGAVPNPPIGVFNSTRVNGENRFTWQPRQDTRIAAVVDHYSSASSTGFVLAGRSLREVEAREDQLTWSVLTIWSLAMLISLIGVEIIFNLVLKARRN